jgi:hypothetical protein
MGVVYVDFGLLAAGAVTLLIPFLKGLLSSGEEAAEQLGEEAGRKGRDFARTLWGKLRGKVEERPAAREAVDDVAARPDDQRARTALEWQVQKLLEEDAGLAGDVQKVLQNAEAANVITVTVTASGDRSIAVGGNVSGSDFRTG